MLDLKPPEPWVCPWGICNHEQAQACRAEPHPRKGCGGRFPPGTTLEQAKKMIGPNPSAPPARPRGREMSDKKPSRPTDEEYKLAALRVRLIHAPRVYACMKCGWPVVDGYCCNTCGDDNPSEPAATPQEEQGR